MVVVGVQRNDGSHGSLDDSSRGGNSNSSECTWWPLYNHFLEAGDVLTSGTQVSCCVFRGDWHLTHCCL